MCEGREKPQSRGGFRQPEAVKEAVTASARQAKVQCELCKAEASLYCQADDAFLCRKCDKWVHGANFIAQRHIRCLLCSTCQGLTHRCLVGNTFRILLPTIVSWGEISRCDSDLHAKCSRTLKRPFLCI